jgi:hypothetical protein
MNNLHGKHCAKFTYEYGDWRVLNSEELILDIDDIKHLLCDDMIQEVDHEDIAWLGRDLSFENSGPKCICCNGLRYIQCDPTFHGIIVDGAPNPFNKRYRMIDGKHRIAKLTHMNVMRSSFYVFHWEEIKLFFKK